MSKAPKRHNFKAKPGYFVHAKGTTRPGSNWLQWWKDYQKTGTKKVVCAYRTCGKTAEDGAHVRRASKNTLNRQYIVPVCKTHHPKREKIPEPFKPLKKSRPVLVSSINRDRRKRK